MMWLMDHSLSSELREKYLLIVRLPLLYWHSLQYGFHVIETNSLLAN